VIDEKERKQYLLNNDSAKIHREFLDKKLEEFSIKTPEDVNQIKATDKEKVAQLDRLEK